MASKGKNSTKKLVNKKVDNVHTSFREDGLKIIKVFVCVLIFLGIFYFLTVYLTNRDTNNTSSSKEVGEAVIQYEEILAGSSFSIDEDEYIVLYYDKSIEELKSNIMSLVSDYEAKEDHLSLYTVDMSSAFNKKFVSDESNNNPASVADLKISDSTLIKFKNGKVVDYIEKYDNIKLYLD